MRLPHRTAARPAGLELKMTPMIDVVFLLLVFFVWTASFRAVEQILPSHLSAATGSQVQPAVPPPEEDFPEVVIRIRWADGQPRWELNQVPADSLDQVRGRLEQIARIKADTVVILDPDLQVPIGKVIEVYDMARLVGLEKVCMAVAGPL